MGPWRMSAATVLSIVAMILWLILDHERYAPRGGPATSGPGRSGAGLRCGAKPRGSRDLPVWQSVEKNAARPPEDELRTMWAKVSVVDSSRSASVADSVSQKSSMVRT